MNKGTLGNGSADLNTAPHAQPKRLVVIAGQSNGLGLCTAANVNNYPGLTTPYQAVQLDDDDATVVADPPVWKHEGPRSLAARTTITGGSYVSGMGGVELTLMRELDQRTSGTKWFCGKKCIDGSSLISHWNNAAYPTAGPALRDQLITYITNLANTYGVTNLAENLVLVWVQGEADTGQLYSTYLTALQSFFGYLRATLGNFRILVHRLTSKNDVNGNVRAAECSWVADDDGRSCMSAGDDLSLRDGAHYVDNDYATLGVRMADVLIDLLNATVPANPRFMGFGPISIASSTQGFAAVADGTHAKLELIRHRAGDKLFLAFSALGQNPIAVTGWTQVANSPQHDAGNSLNARLQVFTLDCVQATMDANGGQMPVPTIADVASDDSKICVSGLVRGASAVDVTAGDTATTATSGTVPGVTTGFANELILDLCAIRVDLATPQFSAFANASLTKLTEHINFETSSGAGFGIGGCSGVKVAAGAVSGTTFNLANTSDQARLKIAFKP